MVMQAREDPNVVSALATFITSIDTLR